MCQQEQQHLERLLPEFDPHTLFPQFARMQLDFEYTKVDRAAIHGHTRSW